MFLIDLIVLVASTPATPVQQEDITSKLLVAALSAGGLGAIVTSIIAAFVSRRKLGAEATEIITKAAAGVVTNLQAENDRQAKRMETLVAEHAAERKTLEDKMDAMAQAFVNERREWKNVLTLHVAWDAIAIAKMAELGVELPPAPPVTPAQQFVDDHGHPRT